MMEHVCDLRIPSKFKGKKVALYAITNHIHGYWKRNWHWEGISVTINLTNSQKPEKVIFLDKNGNKEEERSKKVIKSGNEN